MRISGLFLVVAGVFALGACTGSSGPSEKAMQAAVEKDANRLGGQIDDPRLKNAIEQCKAGAAEVTDEGGHTMNCRMLCGDAPGACDLSVKITEFKKGACTEMKEQKGVFECSYTMVANSPSKWLDIAIHDGDPEGVPENTIPRTTRFTTNKGEWVVAR